MGDHDLTRKIFLSRTGTLVVGFGLAPALAPTLVRGSQAEVTSSSSGPDTTFTLDSNATPAMIDAVRRKMAGSDPIAYFQSAARSLNFVIAVSGNDNWEGVLKTARDANNKLNRSLAGRPPGGDWGDHFSDVISGVDAAGRAVPYFGSVLSLGGAAAGVVVGKVLGDIAGTGRDILGLSPIQNALSDQRADYASDSQYNLVDAMKDKVALVDSYLANICGPNPDCARIYAQYDPKLAAAIGDWSQTPASIVQTDTGKQIFSVYNVSVHQDGALKGDLNKFNTDVQEQFAATQVQITNGFGEVHNALGDINVILGDLNSGQTSILKWIDQQDKQQAVAERVAKAHQVVDAVFQAASADLGALAAVVGVVNPKLGSDISKFGSAGLQVLQAGRQLVDAVNIISEGFQAVTALGCAAATGNFIGAAFQLISLFGGSGPSADQMILQEIDGLRKQMDQFHADVDARFNHVDSELNAIYKGVSAELQLIDWKLGKLLDSVDNIQSRLVGLAIKLTGLEEQLLAYFQVVERGSLRQKMDDSWSRASRGLPMSANEYSSFESFFHEWATFPNGEVWQNIEQPVFGRPTDDESLASELSARISGDPGAAVMTPNDNLSYVKQALVDRGLTLDDGTTPVPNPPLPNPQTWAMVAASYARLQADWAKYANLADPATLQARRADMAKGGQDVANYLRLLLGNKSVFQALIQDYVKQVGALGRAFDQRMKPFMQDKGSALGRNTNPQGSPPLDPVIDLFQGPTQRFGFAPSWLTTIKSSAGGVPDWTNADPAFFQDLVPPSFLSAEWFTNTKAGEQGKLSAEYHVYWDDSQSKNGWGACDPQERGGPKRCPIEITLYRLAAIVTVYYNGTVIARTQAIASETYGSEPSLDRGYEEDWPDLMNQLYAAAKGGKSSLTPPEQAALAPLVQQTTAVAESHLQASRSEFYQDLATTQLSGKGSAVTEAA